MVAWSVRTQTVVPIVALLGGCGRFDFDSVTSPDATSESARRSYSEEVLADQPRAYYRLGEIAGTTARDSIGGADAELLIGGGGMVELGRPGALSGDPDTAMRFVGDGNLGMRSAWARLPAVWSTWAGDFTIEMFVRPTAPAPTGFPDSILVCEDYLNNGFRTGWDASLRLRIWSTEANATGTLYSSISMTLGAWHHVAFTRRGTTVEIFIDAQSVGSIAYDYVAPAATAECGFGSFHGMPSDGELDELAIYEVALSQDQLAAHVAAARDHTTGALSVESPHERGARRDRDGEIFDAATFPPISDRPTTGRRRHRHRRPGPGSCPPSP